MTLREHVYAEDDGKCVGCGKSQARNAGVWAWQAHHCLKAQWLTRHGVSERAQWRLCVLLCRRCHERHESRTAVVPLERLPQRIVWAASSLGEWAEDLLLRYHAPDAGRHPARIEGAS